MGILRRWVGEPSTINTRATVDDGTLNTRSYYLCFDFRVIVTCANHFRGFALRDLGWAFQIQEDITFAGLWAVNSGYSEFVKMGYPDLIREMRKRSG